MYNLFNNILKARCYAGFLYGMHSCLSAYNWSQIISECQEAKARGTKVRDWLETRGISHDTYYVTALFRGIKKPQLSL